MNVIIVSGGRIDIPSSKKKAKEIMRESETFVIAVDGGLKAVNEMEIMPNVIIGDFDTVDKNLLQMYEDKEDIIIVRLNPVKDSTDTEEALNYIIKNIDVKMEEEVILFGSTGGRFDHSLANLFLMKKALLENICLKVYTKDSFMFMIDSDSVIERDENYKYISFIQFDGPARGVTLKGFKYNIENFNFDTKETFRLGISNEFDERFGTIKIMSGCLLIIMSKDDHER